MNDPDAIFARKLAFATGRWDWWEVYDEHTPREWAHQVAQFNAEPWGEDRADIRQAFHTAYLIASQSAKPLSDEDFNKLITALRTYLKIHQHNSGHDSDMDLGEIGRRALSEITKGQ